MVQRLSTAIEHRRRLRRAFFHLQERIAAEPDARLDLAELASVACMSVFHFLRLYRDSVLETPLATVRRLRLRAAARHLAANPDVSVTETALAFGYSSPQSFARAFRAAFGGVPGHRLVMPETPMRIDVTRLPAIVFGALPVQETGGLPWPTYDRLVSGLEIDGIPRRERKVFGLVDSRQGYRHACVAEAMPGGVGLRAMRIAGGTYLRVQGHPDAVWPAIERGTITALRDRDRAMVIRHHTDPSFCEREELRISLYVPVRRRCDLAGVGGAWLA